MLVKIKRSWFKTKKAQKSGLKVTEKNTEKWVTYDRKVG